MLRIVPVKYQREMEVLESRQEDADDSPSKWNTRGVVRRHRDLFRTAREHEVLTGKLLAMATNVQEHLLQSERKMGK
jgi:hypothetical protein